MARSLRRAAVVWMTALITGVGVGGAALAYGLAWREANRFMDGTLRQIALNAGPGLRRPVAAPLHHDAEDDFVVDIWDAAGRLVHAEPAGVDIPRQAGDGFATIEAAGRHWRVFTSGDASQTIQVAQQMEVRRELAESAALQAGIPILVIVPVGSLVVGWAMRRALADLRSLASEVESLSVESREPIDLARVPVEAAPIVVAMNRLIERLRRTLVLQRKFLSDAAHELRTPLTALNLQIGNLGSAATPGKADVEELRRGARRAATLVDQMLRMARYDIDAGSVDETGDVDLTAAVLEAVADHIPLAESRSVDLGVTATDPVRVDGREGDLRILFGNLIDNAVKYTPEGGTVDVAVTTEGSRFRVEVTDTGPGIGSAVLPRVFDRFVRAAPQGIEGSGLGLAISKAIAERQNLRLALENRSDRPGLRAVATGEVRRAPSSGRERDAGTDRAEAHTPARRHGPS